MSNQPPCSASFRFCSGRPAECQQLRATQQLVPAALLRTDLQYARSSAVSLDQTLRFHVQSSAAGSCYVIHTGSPSACTCTPEGRCQLHRHQWTLRSVQLPVSQRIGITSNSTSMAFGGTQGTVTPTGTLTVRNDQVLN
ncbi:MAG: GspH/FimT family protein [Rubrivivax sp.]|nr:GspH/FimT family protein [Rubrivivax sp.]